MPEFKIGPRWVGDGHIPLVVAEAGINHAGNMVRALELVDLARAAGAEVVKFQTHIPRAEMTESCPWWSAISAASFDEQQERSLKAYAESRGLVFLSTPFSIEAVDRLVALGVQAIKIGSGECSNLPLIKHAASYGLPMIVSTGMHGLAAIRGAVEVIRAAGTPYALMHCTSEYPTQYRNVRLGALAQLREAFPDAVIGLSCHSLGIYTALAAVALGASIVEKHFRTTLPYDSPDREVSLEWEELGSLIVGSRAIHAAMGGGIEPLPCETACADVALHRVVATQIIRKGERFTRSNTALKRTGGKGMLALDWPHVLTCEAKSAIGIGSPICAEHLSW